MKKWIFGITGISVLVWLLSADLAVFADATSFFSVRRTLTVLSGIAVFALMGFSMVLALRLPVFERWVGGLDRIYYVHKWAGISAGIFLAVHYLIVDAPKWLVGAGMMTRPARNGGPRPADAVVTIPGLKDLGETVGEYAMWIMLGVVIVALVRVFPWRLFRYVHKLFPLLFLAGAFHAVVLMPISWWLQPSGIWVAFWAIAGSAAAVWSLAGQVGLRRRHAGIVRATRYVADAKIFEVDVELRDKAMPHAAGQFAFVAFEGAADAHPFTIASADQTGRTLRFAIKQLGDLTNRLPDMVRAGQNVRIEGPYGRFIFAGRRPQIWVAGGIGITPFLARLESLIQAGGAKQPTTLHYCVANERAAAWPEDLPARCAAAGVNLQMHIAERGDCLDAGTVAQAHTDKTARWPDIWFCGPLGFADMLKAGLGKLGLPARQFHNEMFQMR